MERSHPWCMGPPYCCDSCGAHDAIVFCPVDGARLCAYCDAGVHAATTLAGLHKRAALCDICGAATAALRCDAVIMACAACAHPLLGPTRADVTTYTGCPDPADLIRLVSVQAPPQQQELTMIVTTNPNNNDTGGGMCEVAKKLLADHASSSTSAHDDDWTSLLLMSSALLQSDDAISMTTMMMPSSQDPTTNNKKREERHRAKLRYNEKKKNRSFCNNVMYACRKERADTRKRVKGRFASSSSTS
ncbi:hypothetical protein QOZ80_6AG0505520 [Eleusine coracana subsp. coracana]|nr:hypothetical protein QOZ80_6AG0505520 [Eleusine coracana subsp. coracana]